MGYFFTDTQRTTLNSDVMIGTFLAVWRSVHHVTGSLDTPISNPVYADDFRVAGEDGGGGMFNDAGFLEPGGSSVRTEFIFKDLLEEEEEEETCILATGMCIRSACGTGVTD